MGNQNKLTLFLAVMGICFSFLIFSGCDGEYQQSTDGDFDEEASIEEETDGDSTEIEDDATEEDFELSEKETEAETDGDLDAETDEEVHETTETADSENELEAEQADGDTDLSEEDLIDEDSELDEDFETIEEEIEPEIEEETPKCTAEDDPLSFMQIVDEPYFSSDGYYYEGTLNEECLSHGFIFAGAKGMKVSISANPVGFVTPLYAKMTVAEIAAVSKRREHTTYFEMQDSFPLSGLDYTFTLPYSGEYLVMLSGKNLSATGDYSLSASCVENCATKFTRNPIVLMHGMGGFDSAFFNLVNYFQGVEENLINNGYNVHTTEVAMFNDSQYRANEVQSQLMEILTQTGARKINITAHSQGGLDARYFISSMGHGADVAVLAMLATPHKGSVVADVLLGNITGIGQDIIVALLDFFANLIDGSEADVKAALSFITRDYMMNTFNPQNPDDPRVQYWSWAGITCNLLTTDCNENLGHDRVGLELSITYGIIKNGDEAEGFGPNDGMVQYKSAEYGEFMGYVSADHADEIGQFKSGDFDHKKFYRNVSAMMFERGF